jgi:serine/threonine protein kinase
MSREVDGSAALVRLAGPIDERFRGLDAPAVQSLVIDVSGLTRITSFGVRQWLIAMEAIPRTVELVGFVGCPPFFIDQLNMVLNFCGRGRVLTALAPCACKACGAESNVLVDVLTHGARLATELATDEGCPRCGGALALSEVAESYFAFVKTCGATSLPDDAARLLARAGVYTVPEGTAPPREAAKLLKLVHEAVTYFRISGPIDERFRARPFLAGLEGEVVLDLKEVDLLTGEGAGEWMRLIDQIRQQISSVTLIDLSGPFLDGVAEHGLRWDGITAFSAILPYRCQGCGKTSLESVPLRSDDGRVAVTAQAAPARICPGCGGRRVYDGLSSRLASLVRLAQGPQTVTPATRDVIARREEMLSRALVQAQAGPAPGKTRTEGILGKYSIVRALSIGGMAEVFLAVHKGIGGFEKLVALKRIRRVLLERRHMAVEMFLNEAKIAASLSHPGIVQILDVGEEEGLLYLAMEYVRGKDVRVLQRRLAEVDASFPLPEALYIGREVALALHHAYHATDLSGRPLKVVHRDVSPHNVLLGFDGAVKLADFGVALATAIPGRDPNLAGKFPYMSPEQARGGALDQRSDLFSLGVVLYELATGLRPFARASVQETLAAVRQARYAPIREVAPQLPTELEALIARLLARSPTERFDDGRQVARAIEDLVRQLGWELRSDGVARLLEAMFPPHVDQGADGHSTTETTIEDQTRDEIGSQSFSLDEAESGWQGGLDEVGESYEDLAGLAQAAARELGSMGSAGAPTASSSAGSDPELDAPTAPDVPPGNLLAYARVEPAPAPSVGSPAPTGTPRPGRSKLWLAAILVAAGVAIGLGAAFLLK